MSKDGLFGLFKNGRRCKSLLGNNYERRDFEVAHEGTVTCLSRAGRPGTCVSGGHDSVATKVVIYDYFSGKIVQAWTGHRQRVTRVTHGAVADIVASGSKDRSVQFWMERREGPLTSIDAHDLPITGLVFSPDNKLLCSGSRDNAVKMWDVSSGNLVAASTIARNLVTHLAWIPDSSILVQTSEDRHLRLWDSRCLKVMTTFPKKQHFQTHCDVTVDGYYVLTGSNGTDGNGCEASLWDTRAVRLMHDYNGHRQSVNSCLFVRLGGDDIRPHHVVTVSQDGTARLWSRDTAECLCLWSVDDGGGGGGAINDVVCLDDDSLGVATYSSGIHRLLRGLLSTQKWALKEVANF